MNKILQNIAKRNMAKAASVMMLMLGAQQSQADMWGSLAAAMSSVGDTMYKVGGAMKNYVAPAVMDLAMKAYENPWTAAGTVLGTAATAWGGKKLYNYWHQPSTSVDNAVNATQTKDIETIHNDIIRSSYPATNLGNSVLKTQNNTPENALNSNTSVNKLLDSKTVELVNRAAKLGIDASVDGGKFFVDGYENGFDKDQMDAYLVGKELDKDEISQGTAQTN